VSLESGIDKCIEELTRKLNQCAHTEDCIDLASWVQWYAFDVIGQLFFSHPFGFLEHAHDHAGYIRALDLVVPLIAVACVMPAYIRPVFLLVGILVPRISKAMRALKHIEHASEACVVERQQLHNNIVADKHTPTDMLESFFAIMRKREERADFGSTEVKMEVYGALYDLSFPLRYIQLTQSASRALIPRPPQSRQSSTTYCGILRPMRSSPPRSTKLWRRDCCPQSSNITKLLDSTTSARAAKKV
jgi:hypothetical protein